MYDDEVGVVVAVAVAAGVVGVAVAAGVVGVEGAVVGVEGAVVGVEGAVVGVAAAVVVVGLQHSATVQIAFAQLVSSLLSFGIHPSEQIPGRAQVACSYVHKFSPSSHKD